jgi:tetratricopeptide (TPR) repeat protein
LEYQESLYLHSLSHHELGILFTLKGQYEFAEEHCLKAISLIKKGRINGLDEYENDKRTAKAFKRLGNFYRNTNRYKESIESFKSALEELKNCKLDDVEGIEERAFVYIRLGKMMIRHLIRNLPF